MAVKQILAATVAIFFLDVLAGGLLSRFLALTPALVMAQPWTIVTSIFLHGGIMHIFLNMFGLLMFGPILEAKIGGKNFVYLYLISGIIGNLGYILTAGMGGLPVLGASGAIYGILGALAVLQPNLMVLVWFMPMPIYMAAVAWFFIELGSGITGAQPGIANFAHLFGLFGGIGLGMMFKKEIISKGGWLHEDDR